MALFALSCVGLLLFLWLSFGGPIPLNPRGYEFKASFTDASQLATEADVRIAGVTVGKVIGKSLDPVHNRTMVTMEVGNQFAPIHQDARAILRVKTIAGETYVQVTSGTPGSPALPDGAMLKRSNVTDAVQLDQIFNALDPKTRAAFRQWQRQLALAIKGNGQNLSNVFGNLPTFAADTTDLLQVLDVQHTAVVRLVRNGGTVFAALNSDPAALRNLITSAETTFHTTAADNTAIAATFHVFPTFLDETKKTMTRLRGFSQDTDPLVKELEPVARALTPTLTDVQRLSPSLRNFLANLGPLITASETGLPATSQVLNGAQPLLGSIGPFLEQLNPILSWLSLHQQLMSDFISNGGAGLAAKTTSFSGGVGHYLRQFSPIGPETLSYAANRDAANRGNTYPPPLWAADPQDGIRGSLPAWDCTNAGGQRPATNSEQACWVPPPLPGAQPGQIPHIKAAHYSK